MSRLHVGLDLDNTLIDYDHVFGDVGILANVLPHDHKLASKEAVKAFLLSRPKGDEDWMRLQGQVYGRYMDRARLTAGAPEFLHGLRGKGVRFSIVSHKTKYGHFDVDRIDLWERSMAWLESQSFFASTGFDLHRKNVHFLESREEKINRIAEIGCHVFVDDLPAVLRHERFPDGVQRVWFARLPAVEPTEGLKPHNTWEQIAAVISSHPLLQNRAVQ